MFPTTPRSANADTALVETGHAPWHEKRDEPENNRQSRRVDCLLAYASWVNAGCCDDGRNASPSYNDLGCKWGLAGIVVRFFMQGNYRVTGAK